MLLKEWLDCYVHLEGTSLHVGNAKIERKWSFSQGWPVSISILDKNKGGEWLANETNTPMFQLPGWSADQQPETIYLSTLVGDDFGISRPYLQTNVDMYNQVQQTLYRLTIKLYPDAAFVRHEITVIPEYDIRANETELTQQVKPYLAWTKADYSENGMDTRSLLRLDTNNKQKISDIEDSCDHLELRDLHSRWETMQFLDQTDTNNNLVSRDTGLLYVNEKRRLPGNLLFLKRTLQHSGLLVIKEGPTSLGNYQHTRMDFHFRGKSLSMMGTGIQQEDLAQKEELTSYGITIGVYDGTTIGGYDLLHSYHRNLRRHHTARDSFMMSNTWGDRSKDGAINETFLIRELHAAAELGLSILQIDDGWQKGVTVNSVNAATKGNGGLWSDYYSGDGDFWEVHPDRFPNGLIPIVALARELGIGLGLWFSPDAKNDYINWEKDVATLLHLYRKYQICAFKLDGIEIRSKLGERRLLMMMRYVLAATQGHVDFNIDTTAQKRLGYFGQTQYGSIFLENRYTDWRNYYPHWTLRNLWLLAPYMPTSRLQMEFLNVNRNKEKYAEDPLAPAACGQVYAFATVAFANPLAWMELNSLEDTQMASLTDFIQALKPYHSDIVAGHVLPIGEEPNGASWTGLQSICGPTHGYLLIIRELHEADTTAIKLWNVQGVVQVTELIRMDVKDEVISHSTLQPRQWESTPQGDYVVTRPAPFTFSIYRYDILPT
ncbi:alpha-galactosidase [Paenibacillus qinlingensis]|uniref:Alpha-galactosidase n=1 Tax=Paenibacillus qinlingensis TaxID=1837343 RepID=A0ABU1NR46_9BACL|nr:alpha-galactosidase [Paenibacillus qinlingensis]MDR6549960.1 hypothetical protein [Paenibacillus qinlingensis]